MQAKDRDERKLIGLLAETQSENPRADTLCANGKRISHCAQASRAPVPAPGW